MFASATVRNVALGVGAGAALGSTLAIPSVLHDLDPEHSGGVLQSGLGRALAGFATNLAIPGALLIASGAAPNPGLRAALQAAAAGVTMGWWGTKSFGDLGPEGMSHPRTP